MFVLVRSMRISRILFAVIRAETQLPRDGFGARFHKTRRAFWFILLLDFRSIIETARGGGGIGRARIGFSKRSACITAYLCPPSPPSPDGYSGTNRGSRERGIGYQRSFPFVIAGSNCRDEMMPRPEITPYIRYVSLVIALHRRTLGPADACTFDKIGACILSHLRCTKISIIP